MAKLTATLIDVGWGDSILLEIDAAPRPLFGLIDSNDTVYYRSSFIYLRRYFEKLGVYPTDEPHLFEFVLLSHAHADHAQGLKGIMREFGTKQFWYPKSLELAGAAELLRYARLSGKVLHHQAVDDTKTLSPIGDVQMRILWPPHDQLDDNENNNSVVLAATADSVTFMLTGDAEIEVWDEISSDIPADTLMFKIPHHGSRNGIVDSAGNTPWLDACPAAAVCGISSHVRPFRHPHDETIQALEGVGRSYYRTDRDSHVSFITDGQDVQVRYSHV